MAAKKKSEKKAVAKTASRTNGKAVRLGGPKSKGRVRKVETDPAKKAKLLAKRAERLDRLAAHWTRLAAKCRAQAAKLATKTLAKPKCRYSPKMQAALAELAKLGQELEAKQVETNEAEALAVVAEVLKGEFK